MINRPIIPEHIRKLSRLRWIEYAPHSFSLTLSDYSLLRITQDAVAQWVVSKAHKGTRTELGRYQNIEEAVRNAESHIPPNELHEAFANWRDKPTSEKQLETIWKLDHAARLQFGTIPVFAKAAREKYPTMGEAQKRIDELCGRRIPSETLERWAKEAEVEGQTILTSGQELVEKFVILAQRKVSRRDEYDQENWRALPTLIHDCIRRLVEPFCYMASSGKRGERGSISSRSSHDAQHDTYLEILYNYIYSRLENEFRTRYSSSTASQNDIHAMGGESFELHIRQQLVDAGLTVEMTPHVNDQGADLIVITNNGNVAIQAKRWERKVGNSAIQEIVAAKKYYNCIFAFVVTNSTFTTSARDLARSNSVILIDGTELHLLPQQIFAVTTPPAGG